MISMIVCTDLNGAIGKNNDLIFNIKEDMKFFRETTKGKIILMGLNTWNSLPKKPLPNRNHIVIGHLQEELNKIKQEHPDVVTLDNLIQPTMDFTLLEDELCVIGGASIYNQFIKAKVLDVAYVTIVHTKVKEADVHIDLNKLKEQFEHHEVISRFEHEGILVEIVKFTHNKEC